MSTTSDVVAAQEKSERELLELGSQILAEAKSRGATDASVRASEMTAVTVKARAGDIESVEYDKTRAFDVTVYIDQNKGETSTTSTSKSGVAEAVQRAIDIARYTESDPACGLPDRDRLATEFQDFDDYYPTPLNPDDLSDRVLELDAATNNGESLMASDGSSAFGSYGVAVLGNSHGFLRAQKSTSYGLYAEAVAVDKDGNKQVEGWLKSDFDLDLLPSPADVGKVAADRALARLNPRSIETGTYPVLFDSRMSNALYSSLIGAISGSSLYTRASYLCDSLGNKVATEKLTLREHPHLVKGTSSNSYDGDGVATQGKSFIHKGEVQSYVLGTYSARRLGMETTGNAGYIGNLTVETPTKVSFESLLKEMDKGVLVTQLKGQGADIITGNFSSGVAGFWVENGEIQFAIENVTIAGKLDDVFGGLVGFGDDVDERRSLRTGSTLVEAMTVAAA